MTCRMPTSRRITGYGANSVEEAQKPPEGHTALDAPSPSHLLAEVVAVQSDHRGQQRVEHELLVRAQLRASKCSNAVQQHLRRLENKKMITLVTTNRRQSDNPAVSSHPLEIAYDQQVVCLIDLRDKE